MNNLFVVTGGPGGGKTTILTALAEHGYRCVPESARELIQERLSSGLSPRPEATLFANDILKADIDKYQKNDASEGFAFFDRGVPDALWMLDSDNAITPESAARYMHNFPYNRLVFILPPWEEIYGTDSERDQTFDQAVEVFAGLKRWYQRWGYETLEVPCRDVEERVSFVLEAIDTHP